MNTLRSRYRLLWLLTQSNAIYDADVQQLGWPRSGTEFAKFTLCVFGIVAFTIFGLSVVSILTTKDAPVSSILYSLIAINIVFTIVIDFYAVLNTEQYISRQIDMGEWTGLHLHGLPAIDIVHSKYDVVRLRIRRLIIAMQILRTAPYMYIVIFGVLDLVLHGFVGAASPSLFYSSLGLMIVLPIAVLLVRYEPRWQLNTLAALGLTIAMFVRAFKHAMLIGIVAVVLLRGIEMILLWCAWILINSSVNLATDKAILHVLLILLLLPVFIFGLHALVRIVALDRAIRLFQ